MIRTSVYAATMLLASWAGAWAQNDAARPLFAQEAPLELRIEAPFARLLANVDDRSELDGSVRYRQPDGAEVVLDAQIRVRGKSRLDVCDFPPLRVDFDRGALAGTVFAGQNRLKLVTLCKRRDASRDDLAEEFQIYKAYNALTDFSFRVRWLSVEYVDSENANAERFTEPAFFIEEDWEVAQRHGFEVLDAPRVALADRDARLGALLSVFQFMIANVDWAGTEAAPDEDDCCHNGKPIRGPERGVIILPYDFDQSGLVSAAYARPMLDLKAVRQRRYRGYCADNGEIERAVQTFNEQRATIERIFDTGPVEERARRTTLDFIAAFYEIINDEKKRQREIISRCRG